MESEYKVKDISEKKEILLEKNEELELDHRKKPVREADPKTKKLSSANRRQRNGAALRNSFAHVQVKSPAQIKRENEAHRRQMVEQARHHLRVYQHRTGEANIASAEISRFNKRMEAAERKEACSNRVEAYERAQAEQAQPAALGNDFAAECRTLSTVTYESFLLANDVEFSTNLEHNYGLVRMAERVNAGLLSIYRGERQDTLTADQKRILRKQIALCREMKKWMDAKKELMKNPYYIYLAGKDITNRQALLNGLTQEAQDAGTAGYRESRKQFLQYLRALERVEACAVKRRKLFKGDRASIDALEAAVNRTETEVKKDHNLEENRSRRRLWEESLLKNDAVPTEDPFLTKEDKTFPERVFEQKKNAFLSFSLTELKCRSEQEILENVSKNAPMINQALEMQRLLGQMVYAPDYEITTEQIIELRAKIHVILMVSKLQYELMHRTFRSGDEDLREESSKEWKRRKKIMPIQNPNALYEELKTLYTERQAQAGESANSVWTLLNRGVPLAEVSRQDRASEAQKNNLVWENLHDTIARIGKATGEVILTLKQICKADKLEFQMPPKAVLFYLRGRSAAEIRSVYRRYTGTPKERFLLYKEIVDKAKDEFNPRRYDYNNLSENGKCLQDYAHRANLAAIMDQAMSCSEAMKTILQDNPELALDENEAVDEEWHKEAAALSKFSADRLMPVFRCFQHMTNSAEKRRVLSAISFDELRVLYTNRTEILTWLNNQRDQPAELVNTLTRLLHNMDSLGSLELSLEEDYRSYRNAEHIDENRLREKQEYRRILDMETDPSRTTETELKKVRRACLVILNEKYALDEAVYFKLTTAKLKALTCKCLKEGVLEENLQAEVNALLAKEQIAPEEELEDALEAEWEEGEQKILGLFCALADGLKDRDKDPGVRAEDFRNILIAHSETVAAFLSDYTKDKKKNQLLSEMTKKMGRLESEVLNASYRELDPVFAWIADKLGEGKITASRVEAVLANKNYELTDALEAADQRINGHLETLFTGMEASVGEWTEKAIGTELDSPESMTASFFEAEEERKKDNQNVIHEEGEQEVQQKKKKKKEKEKDIYELLRDSMSREKGEGKFITLAMKNYFRHSSAQDKRLMVNALLHDLKPVNRKASRKAQDVKQAGRYLGGMIKGAGPLFQKLMQGVSDDLFLPEIRRALDDVKSNLAPIDDAYVKQKFDELKQESEGRVTEIRKLSSLGAASVGQAFLCRIYGPNLPTAGKDVVIKLLRPNIRARLEREKKILRVAARCTDNDKLNFDREMEKPLPEAGDTTGMEATHITQVEKIMEELDMSIEVENARQGYETYHSEKDPEVDTVKVNEDLPVFQDAYALDKAEGMTVERYLNQLAKRKRDALKPFRAGSQTYAIQKGQMPLYEETRARLLRELESVMKKQRMLIKTAEKWTEQAIFGTNFYHGDMHAGNIMISENKVTIIDYGNATKLNSDQKNHIMAMMSCMASKTLAEDFLWSFAQLLPADENEEKFERKDHENEKYHPRLKNKGEEFLTKIRKIIAMKDPTDPDNILAGEKISLILKTAQEMGLQLPPEVENFSKSQLRLQNAIDSFNDAVEDIRRDIRRLDEMKPQGETLVDLKAKIHETANLNQRQHVVEVLKDSVNLFEPVSREYFVGEANKKDSKSREEFKAAFTAKYAGLVKMNPETDQYEGVLDLTDLPKWRADFEELKRIAPKSDDEEPSKEYAALKVKLEGEVQACLGAHVDSTKDPMAAFGGILRLLPDVTNKLNARDFDGFEDILSILEKDVPAAVRFMKDYYALIDSQDDAGFFNFDFFKSGKESKLIDSMYENYLRLQETRLEKSQVVVEFKETLNRDYDYKRLKPDAVSFIRHRYKIMHGNKTKTDEAWKRYTGLVDELKMKYFKDEMTEYVKLLPSIEEIQEKRNIANHRLHAEEKQLSAEEKAKLEKIIEDADEEKKPLEKRLEELERILDTWNTKINDKEEALVSRAKNKLQKEFDMVHMEDSYYRHAEALDEEFAELGKEEEGGKELLKAYEEFKTVQLRDMQLRLDGKEVDEDTRKLRKEKESRLIECWKRVSLARLKKHYRDAFETPETIYSPLTNYMKVTGDVIKRNKWKTVSTLGSVSGKLVMRLKDIGG